MRKGIRLGLRAALWSYVSIVTLFTAFILFLTNLLVDDYSGLYDYYRLTYFIILFAILLTIGITASLNYKKDWIFHAGSGIVILLVILLVALPPYGYFTGTSPHSYNIIKNNFTVWKIAISVVLLLPYIIHYTIIGIMTLVNKRNQKRNETYLVALKKKSGFYDEAE